MSKQISVIASVAGVAIVGAAAAYALGRFGGKGSDEISDAEKDVVKSELSQPVSWYSQSSDTLQNQMLKVWRTDLAFGFDEPGHEAARIVIGIIHQLKNRSDWNMLVAKFGKRTGVSVSFKISEPLTSWLIHFMGGAFIPGSNVEYLSIVRASLKRFNVIL